MSENYRCNSFLDRVTIFFLFLVAVSSRITILGNCSLLSVVGHPDELYDAMLQIIVKRIPVLPEKTGRIDAQHAVFTPKYYIPELNAGTFTGIIATV
jgi:hypothetical protein